MSAKLQQQKADAIAFALQTIKTLKDKLSMLKQDNLLADLSTAYFDEKIWKGNPYRFMLTLTSTEGDYVGINITCLYSTKGGYSPNLRDNNADSITPELLSEWFSLAFDQQQDNCDGEYARNERSAMRGYES